MNIIQELELMIADASEAADYMMNPKVVTVSALESLIEGHKNEKPVVITTEMMAHIDKSMECWQENTRVEVFHPPLSDETVKDAERYRWLRSEDRKSCLGKTGKDAGVFIDTEDEDGTLILLTGIDADKAIDNEMAKGN